jgi:hypothetical protein
MHDLLKRSLHLLLMWQERPAAPDRPAVWRFSLEDVRTGQRHGFGSLEGLLAFLRAQVEEPEGLHGQEEGET